MQTTQTYSYPALLLKEGIILANDVLKCVNNYMTCNLLHINLDKSCFMHFPHKSSSIRGGNKQSLESGNSDSCEEDTAENP